MAAQTKPEKKTETRREPVKRFVNIPVRNFTEELGQRISLARRQLRITQQDLAHRSRTSITTYKRIEQGDTTIAVGTLLSVLYCLDELRSCEGILEDVYIPLAQGEPIPQRIRKRKPRPEKTKKAAGRKTASRRKKAEPAEATPSPQDASKTE